jgi:hypothetical protein
LTDLHCCTVVIVSTASLHRSALHVGLNKISKSVSEADKSRKHGRKPISTRVICGRIFEKSSENFGVPHGDFFARHFSAFAFE